MSRLGVVAFSHRGCIRCRRLLAIDPPRAQRHRMPRSACLLTPSTSADIKMIIQPCDIQSVQRLWAVPTEMLGQWRKLLPYPLCPPGSRHIPRLSFSRLESIHLRSNGHPNSDPIPPCANESNHRLMMAAPRATGRLQWNLRPSSAPPAQRRPPQRRLPHRRQLTAPTAQATVPRR